MKLLQGLTPLLAGGRGSPRNPERCPCLRFIANSILADRKAPYAATVAVGLIGSILDVRAVSLIKLLHYLWIAAADRRQFYGTSSVSIRMICSDAIWLACTIVVAVVLAYCSSVYRTVRLIVSIVQHCSVGGRRDRQHRRRPRSQVPLSHRGSVRPDPWLELSEV